MKANVINVEGKKIKEVTLPSLFSKNVREDIIRKVLQIKRRKQPYSPSLIAGKQHSARGKIRHRRHVWQTSYGRGMSRVPRKVMSERGSQFNWEGGEVPQARGGMRTHPPKVISMISEEKINKKELRLALESALSATASKKVIANRYSSLEEKDVKELPVITESKILSLNTKELIKAIESMLGEKLSKVAFIRKSNRAGVGKLRGRRYKKNLGLLLVLGKKEKMKTKYFECVQVPKLNVENLTGGSPGRIVIYTEEAIKELGGKE